MVTHTHPQGPGAAVRFAPPLPATERARERGREREGERRRERVAARKHAYLRSTKKRFVPAPEKVRERGRGRGRGRGRESESEREREREGGRDEGVTDIKKYFL